MMSDYRWLTLHRLQLEKTLTEKSAEVDGQARDLAECRRRLTGLHDQLKQHVVSQLLINLCQCKQEC